MLNKPCPHPSFLKISAFLLLLFAFAGCTAQKESADSEPKTRLTIGIATGENAALAIMADKLGYFSEEGLDITLKNFNSGVAAMEALSRGEVDLAAPAEFVFVKYIHENPDLRIIGAINKVKNIQVLARKDRGIAKPIDLKGKKVGVTLSSISEYFLSKYLYVNRMKIGDVKIVNLPPDRMEEELASGSIDAAIVWNPFVNQIKEILGEAIISWQVQKENPWHLVLVAHDSLSGAQSRGLTKLFKGLIRAEEKVKADPALAQRELSARYGIPEKHFFNAWGENEFKVFIDRSLMLALEEESTWLHKTGDIPDSEQHNFLDFLYLDALKDAKFEAVTIIY